MGQLAIRQATVWTGTAMLLGLAAPACSSNAQWVKGRAQVVTWKQPTVVAFCDSHRRYQLGVFTSNAAGTGAIEVDRWMAAHPAPVIVELTGFLSALPSSWKPAPGVDGVLSVGHIRPVERGPCL
jgi:hypothetical protein